VIKTAGLSLEQAPPIHVPLRLFLTAPFFLLAAATLLGWQGDVALASRWSPAALAVTHLITVGFLGQIMCGALLQILPVIAGAPVPAVGLTGAAVNLLLTAGAALLGWGFIGGGPAILGAGAFAASLGFILFLISAGIALGRAKGAAHTIRGMRLAFGSLVVTVVLGVVLTSALNGWIQIGGIAAWANLHLAWGLIGWVGMLVAGVAFQVVPMFHVTPPYPKWIRGGLTLSAGAGLALGSLLPMPGMEGVAMAGIGLAALGFTLFAAVTLSLQLRRERARVDATLMYWWSAMVSLAAAASAWVLGGSADLVGSLLLVGAGVGVTSGMLLKIVPFLSWFHLQHRQLTAGRRDVRIPHMQTFLPERHARLLLLCHLLGLTALILATSEPELILVASVFLSLSAAGLGVLLAGSLIRYLRVASAFE
jgi:hypothetical protein